MRTLVILKHSGAFADIALKLPYWYFVEMPKRIVKGYGEYLQALSEIFSFFFLIKTFLKPWKSITDAYPTKGLNIGLIAQAFTLNMTSRIIGMIFRITGLIMGLIAEIIALGIFVSVLFFWLFFPLLIILDILFIVGYLS